MKRVCLCVAFSMLGFALMAETAAEGMRKPLDPRFESRLEEAIMKGHGGKIRQPNTGDGEILIFNAQKKFPCEDIKKTATKLTNDLRIDVNVEEAKEEVSIANAGQVVKISGAAVGVFVVDDANVPALLVASEERWAMVNVAKIGVDRAIRVRGEITRAIAQVGGYGVNPSSDSVTGIMTGPADLDRFEKINLGGDAIIKIQTYLSRFGVVPYKTSFYDKACQEGWAPAPSNEWQQVIWDRVHQVPTKGIEIKFDPKKGK